MLYTVKEVAELAGVTVKALHYYHKISLLQPCEITDAGYRLYGWKANDMRLLQILKNHISFLNNHGHKIDAKAFADQARFFLEDDFHRNMLENQQLGLSYYLCITADMYAASNQ